MAYQELFGRTMTALSRASDLSRRNCGFSANNSDLQSCCVCESKQTLLLNNGSVKNDLPGNTDGSDQLHAIKTSTINGKQVKS